MFLSLTLVLSLLGGIHASQVSVAVKSRSDFPKLRLVNLFYTLYAFSCLIQHVPVESARSAGERSKACEVTIVYTLACC